MKLISMKDFVFEIENYFEAIQNKDRALIKIFNYAKFLNKPLELGMFIPCIDGEPINEPQFYPPSASMIERKDQLKEAEQYQESKERVLFEGAKYKTEGIKELILNDCVIYFKNAVDYESWQFTEIEELIHLDLTLTQTAINLIKG